MALVLADRVKESCTSPGVGTATLLGAAAGYKTFSAGVGASNTTYYVIADQIGSNWEVGLGTIGAGGTTLVRTTPLSGSATTPVNFSTGTQDVFCDYTASTAVLASNNPGTSGQVLTSGGIGVAPSWAAIANTGVLSFSAGTTGLTPSTATTGAITVAGVLNAANGGTGEAGTLTGILYGNGTSAHTVATTAQVLSLIGTLPVANGGTGVTTSTGSGSVVLSTSPTLVTPVLGTPSSGTVTNLTGTASININGTVGATTASTGVFTTATANSFIPNLSTIPTNGVYLPATNSIGIATNSTNAVTIDASQNVGIGTSSPSYKLDINGNAGAANYYINALAGTIGYANGSASLAMFNALGAIPNTQVFNTAGAERMRIDSSGNVGIGTSSPASYGKLAVNGSIAPMGAAGTYSIDTSLAGAGTTVSSGGTVNFSNASGMLVVNQYNTGGVTIYLCGGGSTVAVASTASTVGSFALNTGIGGYTWTSSSTTTYGFFFLRTRPTA